MAEKYETGIFGFSIMIVDGAIELLVPNDLDDRPSALCTLSHAQAVEVAKALAAACNDLDERERIQAAIAKLSIRKGAIDTLYEVG